MNNQKGMTLLEIMIVLAIIGGLVTILATQVTDRLDKARYQQAKIILSEIQKSLSMYYTDCGNYPSEEDGLDALLEDISSSDCRNWGPKPYVKENQLFDSWGKDIIYEIDEDEAIVISLGKDGREGGQGYNKDLKF